MQWLKRRDDLSPNGFEQKIERGEACESQRTVRSGRELQPASLLMTLARHGRLATTNPDPGELGARLDVFSFYSFQQESASRDTEALYNHNTLVVFQLADNEKSCFICHAIKPVYVRFRVVRGLSSKIK